jgi:hypothetical protein
MNNTEQIAEKIADILYSRIEQPLHNIAIKKFLIDFAEEIKREALEP